MLIESVNLVAYILETIVQDFPDFSYDALLDNIMVYCLINSDSRSLQINAEAIIHHSYIHQLVKMPTIVPTGCARFCRDVPLSHNVNWKWRDKLSNLIHSSWYLDAEHFDTWERPDLLYHDFIIFIAKVLAPSS